MRLVVIGGVAAGMLSESLAKSPTKDTLKKLTALAKITMSS